MTTKAFDYDPVLDAVTIEGIKYDLELFRRFAFAPIGTVLRIVARRDGMITVQNEDGMRADREQMLSLLRLAEHHIPDVAQFLRGTP